MDTVAVTPTSKGHRVWLQGLVQRGYKGRYTVLYSADTIQVVFAYDGKRTLCASKGGVVDIQSKKVTAWACDATRARVEYATDIITITRG
jgi:hypothetical protein